ncbi:MAG: DUF5615 family PIN-like protein [Thermaceae bacterium]|nr:DUF5615 family PIN-like protein [Thermaceae bacterium]
MRILLDESLPKKLALVLPEHEVRTVPQMGWAGTKNGELLRRAGVEFDVFVTADQNLQYQQNLTGFIAVLVLVADSNRLESLLPLVPALNAELERIQAGTIARVAVD